MTKCRTVLTNIQGSVLSAFYFWNQAMRSAMIYKTILYCQRFSAIFSDFGSNFISVAKKIQKRGQACQTEFIRSIIDPGLSRCVVSSLNDHLIMLFWEAVKWSIFQRFLSIPPHRTNLSDFQRFSSDFQRFSAILDNFNRISLSMKLLKNTVRIIFWKI